MGVCDHVAYLNPWVGGTEFLYKLCPLINHLYNLLFFHEREGDIRPRMETHYLTGKGIEKGNGEKNASINI